MTANNFTRMNNQRFNDNVNENDKDNVKVENNTTVNEKDKEKDNTNANNQVKEKDNDLVNENVNKNVNKNNINQEDESGKSKPQVKTTRFVENLLHSKKEEKVLVGFRLDKSVSDAIDSIVEQHKLKKGEFVNDILKKALGL